jgi:hypothetical protein
MASDIQNNLLFAHKTNIERYRRILQRFLVERRLNEEQTLLKS